MCLPPGLELRCALPHCAFNSSACYAPFLLIKPCFHCILQLESGRRAPQHDAAGERALAAHTAHHHAMTREVQQAQQEAALALQHNCELEQALAASQAVSAARAGGSWLSCLGMLQVAGTRIWMHPLTGPPTHHIACTPLAPPAPLQEVKALLGERRGLQLSLQAAQRESAALAGELAQARRVLAAARHQAEQERQRRAQVEQAWAVAKEVRGSEGFWGADRIARACLLWRSICTQRGHACYGDAEVCRRGFGSATAACHLPVLQAMSEGMRLLSAHHGDLSALQAHLSAARRRSAR